MPYGYNYLYKLRNEGQLTGNRLKILRMLQRANGPVTERLFHYHIWEAHGKLPPAEFHYNISHLRVITGLGIVNHGEAGWMLVPECNASWCNAERWSGAWQ
jgi:hypothetical protein